MDICTKNFLMDFSVLLMQRIATVQRARGEEVQDPDSPGALEEEVMYGENEVDIALPLPYK